MQPQPHPTTPPPTITPPQPPLAGYYYGHDTAPRGHEWQSPDSLAYNKLQPQYLLPLPRRTHRHQSPPPTHHPTPSPSTDNGDSTGHPTPTNAQPTSSHPITTTHNGTPYPSLQLEHRRPTTRRHPTLRHTNLRQPTRNLLASSPPRRLERRRNAHTANRMQFTYAHRNEVGSYRRTFTIPNNWRNRLTYIQFDGVDSFFYLWINGRYVGFSKTHATPHASTSHPTSTKGPNTIAVEVYRSSDASFLEAQDMFRLPGIFRSVHLYSTPKVQISDLVATPRLNADLSEGTLSVATTISNHTNKKHPRPHPLLHPLPPASSTPTPSPPTSP